MSEAAVPGGGAPSGGTALTGGATLSGGEPLSADAPLLRLRDVRFRHAGARAPLFDRLDLDVPVGSCLGLIGPNGSGKTTLLRILAGLLRPESGAVLLQGGPIGALAPRRRAQLLAVLLPEAPLLFNFSVLEVALMGRAPHLGPWGLERPEDFAAARRALAEVDLEEFAGRPVRDLSSGERQRVLLARALAQEPKVLLLDEPTAFLDIKHALGIHEILARLNRERRLTLVLASHDLNLVARYAERLVLLDRGRIAADGSPAEVLTPERLSSVYETESQVVADPVTGAPMVIPRAPIAPPGGPRPVPGPSAGGPPR